MSKCNGFHDMWNQIIQTDQNHIKNVVEKDFPKDHDSLYSVVGEMKVKYNNKYTTFQIVANSDLERGEKMYIVNKGKPAELCAEGDVDIKLTTYDLGKYSTL